MERSENRDRHRKRTALITATLLLLTVGLLGREFYRDWRQERLNRAMLNAIEHRPAQELSVLLHQGANPNYRVPLQSKFSWQEWLQQWLHGFPRNRSTDTALIVAAREGDIDCVQLLLSAGADVNATNDTHDTALTTAYRLQRPSIMLTLLKNGANPNVEVPDYSGKKVPLLVQIIPQYQIQASNYLVPLVQLMLEKGTDINAPDANGDTPLHVAIEFRATRIAHLLIARNADLNRPDSHKRTPLELSAEDDSDTFPVLKDLLEHGVNVLPDKTSGWNLLCWAAKEGNVSVANEAIRRGLPVNSADRNGRTPLMYAVAHERLDLLKLLLAHGADVDLHDDLGWTALMFAAQTDNLKIVHLLLSHGANRDARDGENHWTAEQRAIHLGQESTADLIRHPQRKITTQTRPAFAGNWGYIPTHPTRAQLDSDSWIESVRCPDIPNDAGTGTWAVVVVDRNGHRGNRFGTKTYFFQPSIELFRDTDGGQCAFIRGHHRGENNFVVTIRGRKIEQRAECYARYSADCQPLPDGGALIFQFGRTRDVEGVPTAHENDTVSRVSRYRNGDFTLLGLIFSPNQYR